MIYLRTLRSAVLTILSQSLPGRLSSLLQYEALPAGPLSAFAIHIHS